MKNHYLILILLLISSSCSSLKPLRKLASENSKPRNIIFLVHGITADEKTFGHLTEALTNVLNAPDETAEFQYEYVVQNFIYETRNNKNTT